MATLSPDASQPARLQHLDALRGFALAGILIVNIASFASAYYIAAVPDPLFARPADRAARWLVAFLFETKFYLLFSFLFGYSFTLQMSAAGHSRAAFVPRMLRRLCGLAVIGLAHAVWLYHGDILCVYAVLGLVLLAARGQSERQALRRACFLTVLPAITLIVLGWLQLRAGEFTDLAGALARAQVAQQAWLGSPADVVAQRLREWRNSWWVLVLVQGPCALAMFMAGFAAGQRRVFAHLDAWRSLWPRLAAWGLAVGVPGAVFYANATVWGAGSGRDILGLGVSLLTAPFLSAAYVALALMLFQRDAGVRVVRALAPAGRMALSNYLLQSLACSLIFTGYGLGLMGRVSPGSSVLIALGLFAGQMAASAWWLRRFAYGPVEWVLRALTIGGWPAMRRTAQRTVR
ncbi:DUF418 domain-containing protein [Variovorax sp. DT-64]|uniref:DUF418 domain-containing protein n=1 Tax=Variovorax sp. DT-64 TaxID=3396160 RepID=UPI003F1E378D